jgi:hypothetical protein
MLTNGTISAGKSGLEMCRGGVIHYLLPERFSFSVPPITNLLVELSQNNPKD